MGVNKAIILAGAGTSGKSTLLRVGILGLKTSRTRIRSRGVWAPPGTSEADLADGVLLSPIMRKRFDATCLDGLVVGHLDGMVALDQVFLIQTVLQSNNLLTEVNVVFTKLAFPEFDTLQSCITPVLMPEVTEDEIFERCRQRSPQKDEAIHRNYAYGSFSAQRREYPRIRAAYPNFRQLETTEPDELRQVVKEVTT